MKNVLILGANSDMAQALAHHFAIDGYSLTLAARDPEDLENSVKDLEIRHGATVACAEFDALRSESHSEFYKGLEIRPDVVVCAFGYLGDQELTRTDFGETRKVIDTNYTGEVSILQTVAADFESRGGGTIIGISSVAGDRGRQSNYIYGSAKGAFSIYLAGLRNRLAKSGVHVMTVKPGFVDTKMTAGMDLPPPLTASPDKAAKDIYRAFKKGRNTVYTLWVWRYIMLLIRSIPEFIFKKMTM